MIVRFLFGRLVGPTIKFKTFHYNSHQHFHKPEEKSKETVIIEPKQEQKSGNKSDQLGEYVDYEEVK